VLDGTVDAEDDWHRTMCPRLARRFASTDPYLDLWVDDPDTAHDLFMSLGATVLKDAEDGDSPDTFQVYADPAGHLPVLGQAP
jgi:hypothetical protein